MRRTLLVAATVVVAAAVVALPALAASTTITVGDDFFIKKGGGTVTIKKGTTVAWVFKGKRKHTVVGSGAGSFIDSGDPRKRGRYSLKVNKRGTFKLLCSIHGSKQRMTLKVK
jgi:plastocyanin